MAMILDSKFQRFWELFHCGPVAQSTYKQLDTIDISNSSFHKRLKTFMDFNFIFP